jgi:hypothetical protein
VLGVRPPRPNDSKREAKVELARWAAGGICTKAANTKEFALGCRLENSAVGVLKEVTSKERKVLQFSRSPQSLTLLCAFVHHI